MSKKNPWIPIGDLPKDKIVLLGGFVDGGLFEMAVGFLGSGCLEYLCANDLIVDGEFKPANINMLSTVPNFRPHVWRKLPKAPK